MARPTSATTVSRPDLGAIAFEYAMAADQRGFIGQQVLPVFETPEKTAQYPVIPLEAFLKIPKRLRRAPRGTYNRGDWEFEMGNYNCEEFGHEEPVDEVEARLYRRFFDAEQVASLRATDILLRGYEKRVADMVFNAANYPAGNRGAVTVPWSTAASCTPKADVVAAKKALRSNMGVSPNGIIMSETVFDNVMICDELRDYLQYTSPHLITTREAQRQMLAKYFGVEQVLVAGGMYDTADKGKSAVLADIWDEGYVLLAALATNARDLREPCLGRTFLWTGDSPQMLVVETYREEQSRSDIYRVRHNVEECFVFAGAGYLLSNITASEEEES